MLQYSTLPEPPPDPPPKGALAAIFLIVFTDLLGFGIIIPLLAFYVPDYQEHPLKVTGLFSIYSVCQFIGAPILGALSDRYGRRPVLILSQIGSAAGYLLLGLATQFGKDPESILWMVYLSRVIDGLSGGNISTAQAYISDITTPQTRAKGMGLLGAAFGIGFSAGPALGALLSGHPAWPAYAAALLSFAAAVLTYFKLPEVRIRKPVDVQFWLHPRTFKPVLHKPVLVQLLAISFVTMAAFVMMEATIGIFLNATLGFQQRQVGWYFAFVGVVIAVVQGGLIGRLTKRYGEWPLAIAGPVFVAVGMLGHTLLAWWPRVSLLGLSGITNASGRSLQQPTLSSLLSKFSSRDEQGVVFGMYHGLGSLARVFGPIIAGLMYPYARNTGPYIVAGGIVMIAATWTALVRLRYGPETREAVADPVQVVSEAV